ncbi:MAG: hypothetical protein RL235_743 [Chlamydiota bacterium]|jgi:polyhydroxyalkanoate synthesis regulator phasin
MKNPFTQVQPWVASILSDIKKELRTEHLLKSPVFYRAHFGNRPHNRIPYEEIEAVYVRALAEGSDADLADWVINRWVFQHGDIYEAFAEKLQQVNPDFTQIKELTLDESERVLDGMAERFGALNVYLFAWLNKVAFPESVFHRLQNLAESTTRLAKEEAEESKALVEKEALVKKHARDLEKLRLKCEDKIAGVMRKYDQDVAGLKNQIRALQKRMSGVGS